VISSVVASIVCFTTLAGTGKRLVDPFFDRRLAHGDQPRLIGGEFGRRFLELLAGQRPAAQHAATFQIVLSGIRTTPQRPPHSAVAAGFTGLALARRRGRGR